MAELFEEPFDLPVFVVTDAAAAAMGEMQLGLGQTLSSFFYILSRRGWAVGSLSTARISGAPTAVRAGWVSCASRPQTAASRRWRMSCLCRASPNTPPPRD